MARKYVDKIVPELFLNVHGVRLVFGSVILMCTLIFSSNFYKRK